MYKFRLFVCLSTLDLFCLLNLLRLVALGLQHLEELAKIAIMCHHRNTGLRSWKGLQRESSASPVTKEGTKSTWF